MRAQRGASLVGTLIGLTLGLLVIAAAGALHVAARRAHAVHDTAARLQESGELALAMLAAQAGAAGFVERTAAPASQAGFRERFGLAPVLGCAGGYFPSTGDVDPSTCVPDPAGNDALLFRHQALPDPGDADARLPGYVAVTGEGADCLGQNPEAGGSIVAASAFRVQSGSLACMGNGNPGRSQPMVAGVEQLRVRFPADLDGDGAVDAIVAADDPALAGAAAWDRVRAIELCLLLRSEDATVRGSSVGYLDCASAPRTASDGRMRRLFRSVLELPNRDPGTAMLRQGALP